MENVREKSLSYILSELAEHKEEIKVGEFGGILDHVYGYKKTKDYALVCWFSIFLLEYLVNKCITDILKNLGYLFECDSILHFNKNRLLMF